MLIILITVLSVYALAIIVQLRGYILSINKNNAEIDNVDHEPSFMAPQNNA